MLAIRTDQGDPSQRHINRPDEADRIQFLGRVGADDRAHASVTQFTTFTMELVTSRPRQGDPIYFSASQ